MQSFVTAEQDAFLAEHRWALIATVGARGAPQVTMVAYHWDGHDLILSTKHSSVKWRNVLGNAEVSVTVVDDQRYLTLNGRADAIADGTERDRLTDRLLASLLPADAAILRADIDSGLDAADRVIVRLVPRSAIGRI